LRGMSAGLRVTAIRRYLDGWPRRTYFFSVVSFFAFLGAFLAVFFLLDFLAVVSCAKTTATLPRASERPSIKVISFFMAKISWCDLDAWGVAVNNLSEPDMNGPLMHS